MVRFYTIFLIQIHLIYTGNCLRNIQNPVSIPEANAGGLHVNSVDKDNFFITWTEEDFPNTSGLFNVNIEDVCDVQYDCTDDEPICTFSNVAFLDDCYLSGNATARIFACANITVTVSREDLHIPVSFNLAPDIGDTAITPDLILDGTIATVTWNDPTSSEEASTQCATRARVELPDGSDPLNGKDMNVTQGKTNTYRWTVEDCYHGTLTARVIYLTQTNNYDTVKTFVAHATGDVDLKGVGVIEVTATGTETCGIDVSWDVGCSEVHHYKVIGSEADPPDVTDGTNKVTIPNQSVGTYTIKVQAYWSNTDTFGDKMESDATVITVGPDAPATVQVDTSSNDAVHELSVTWTAPETPVCAGVPTGYNITYCETEECTTNATTTAGANETLILLTELQACTDYTVFVAAIWSDETWDAGSASIKTDGGAPGPPSINRDTISTIHEIELSWIESTTDTSCPLSKYIVKWEPDDGDGSGTHNEVGLNTSDKITDLTCNMNYTVTVTAFAEGDENTSDSKDISTKDKAPGNTTVDSVSPVEASITQLTVKWSIPSYDCYPGSNLSDYKVSWRAEGEGQSTHSQNEASTSYTINDLVYCTTYNISVKARSSTGLLGDPAGTKNATTNADYPEQPIITEKSKGENNIKFSWTESDPIKSNSCPISKYTVDWMPKEGNGSGAYESYTITGLTCNKNYNVTVTATATDDKDTSSQGKIIKTNDKEPGNTTVDSVSPVDANNTQLTVKWSIPSYDCFPGSNLGDYKVSWRAEGEGQSTHSQNEASTSYTINDLVYCTTYTVSVRARSSSGLLGDQAGSKKATTNADKPGKPTITKEIPNTESITLTWKPNIANSCAFAGYTVNWSPDGGDGSDEIGNTSYNITGLTCNKNYTVSVTTRAADDQINTSDEKVITTIDEAPGQVKGAKFVADSSTQFTASWTPPDYDCTESTLGAYKVTWTPGGDAVTIELDKPHLTISNLIPCTEYTVNIAGSSETDITGQIVTSTITLLNDFPGKSTNVTEGDITPHSLEVEWNAPLKVPPYGNNCPITNYTVQCTNITGEMIEQTITDPETRTYTFIELKACTKYNIIVIANTVTGGTASDPAIYETGTNAPPVDTVSITPESRSAHVTWKRPPNTACELEYEVTYTGTTLWTNNKTDNSGELEPINNQDDTVAADLDKLLAYTSYEICVTVITGNTTCNTTETEMEVPTAPRDIAVEEGSKTKVSLTLTWQYPEAENGILLEYWVSWELEGESSNNYTDLVTAEITSYTIFDLDEGTYIFKVIAVNSKGNSLWSEKIEQWMDGPSPVCGGGCIAGIVIGILLVALLIPAFIFRDRIKEKIKPGSPPVEESPYELRGAAILKTDFRQHVEQLGLDRAESAYQMLNDESQQKDKFAATKPFNKGKNRFANIHPFDQTRVKLTLIRNGPKGSDYINANHITFPDTFELEFIATQGPLDSTINDFWRMIWEHNVYDTVMLCNLFEKGKSKCAQYWTENGERSMEFGDFKISCQAEEEDMSKTFITRYIDVFKDGQHRMVKQHHFLAWPDFGVPENEEGLLRFLSFVQKNVNQHGKKVLTHCSAGVGRTGTFIALWVLTSLLEKNKAAKSIDVHKIALMMREGRSDMIQTKDQYLYLHKCLLKYMEDAGNSFLISNKDEEEPIYGNVNTGFQQ